MNKTAAHKEFIYQLERFLQTYFNTGETISTYFLVKELKAQSSHPVHEAYQKYVKCCKHKSSYRRDWKLTDFSRVSRHMWHCEGWFTKTIVCQGRQLWNKGKFQRTRNYITIPGTLRAKTETFEINNNYLLIG